MGPQALSHFKYCVHKPVMALCKYMLSQAYQVTIQLRLILLGVAEIPGEITQLGRICKFHQFIHDKNQISACQVLPVMCDHQID